MLEIFKEISIGGITKRQLIKTLVESGVQFNKHATILFEHHRFSPINKSEKVKLVKATLFNLGMDNPFSFHEVANLASTLGLRICPLYCTPFLRLEHLEQPEGTYLTVASDRPESDESDPNSFSIRNRNFNKTLWLRGYCATNFCEWPIDLF